MNKLTSATARKPAAALLLCLAGTAMATDAMPVPPASPTLSATTSTPVATMASATARSPFSGATVSQRLLANSRAGSATAVVTENGSLQQTTASNVQTGTNAIVGGSFANALGLTTVIQNSGANVLIQNATTINVQFK